MVAPDPHAFRSAIGAFPTGVAVVTALGDDGPAGLTTNAVTSLSLDPVMLLVCFANDSRTLPVVLGAQRFAVNLLCDDQEGVARTFASKSLPHEKFEAATHTVADGVPVLDDVLAWFACEIDATHPGGDHTIVVGRVRCFEQNLEAAPLVFSHGSFGTVGS